MINISYKFSVKTYVLLKIPNFAILNIINIINRTLKYIKIDLKYYCISFLIINIKE